ncbi:MAG: hypothetical protein KBT34_14945 [Prevotella sp.]|nr:hypothetical protein [Candidatus Prevotella equi]
MGNKLKNKLGKLLYGYNIEKEIQEIDERFVVAGDPAYELDEKFIELLLPRNEQSHVEGLCEYEVRGYSMYPCGISNADHLYVKHQVSAELLQPNDFILVKVNPDDYPDEDVYFKHKLRRFLLNTDARNTVDQIVEELRPIQPEAVLPSYQQKLSTKLQKSLKRYPEATKFSLSFTFKDGELRYSFHPCEHLEGKVEYVYSRHESRLIPTKMFSPYK